MPLSPNPPSVLPSVHPLFLPTSHSLLSFSLPRTPFKDGYNRVDLAVTGRVHASSDTGDGRGQRGERGGSRR